LGQSLFQAFCAIALTASPALGPVFVATIAPRMRVFHRQEIKIFFPIGALFFEWRITKTSFDPVCFGLWHSRAPSACRTSTRRPRLTRDQASGLQSPWPKWPCARLSPVPLSNNALQNLDRHRPFPNCETKREHASLAVLVAKDI
jgi:hypothetical protein